MSLNPPNLRAVLSRWLSWLAVWMSSEHIYLPSPRKHIPSQLSGNPNGITHTYLHRVASQSGSPFKSPALLLGHHEELGQALLHNPGKTLVVEAHQRIVHALQHCGGRRQRGCSEDRPPADSETTTTISPRQPALRVTPPYLILTSRHPHSSPELGIVIHPPLTDVGKFK